MGWKFEPVSPKDGLAGWRADPPPSPLLLHRCVCVIEKKKKSAFCEYEPRRKKRDEHNQ